jgi:hypothetical protein
MRWRPEDVIGRPLPEVLAAGPAGRHRGRDPGKCAAGGMPELECPASGRWRAAGLAGAAQSFDRSPADGYEFSRRI